MSNRQRLARERLEIYLVHLLMAYRPLIFIVGVLLLVYSIANLFINPLVGFASLLPALYLLLISHCYGLSPREKSGEHFYNPIPYIML